MTEERLVLAELLEKAGDGDFLETGSARTAFPRLAQTVVTGTLPSTIRIVASTIAPPLLHIMLTASLIAIPCAAETLTFIRPPGL